jgi:hypothetical protein
MYDFESLSSQVSLTASIDKTSSTHLRHSESGAHEAARASSIQEVWKKFLGSTLKRVRRHTIHEETYLSSPPQVPTVARLLLGHC